MSQNLTSWYLACSYSGGGCAGRFELTPIAARSIRENLNSSGSIDHSSSSSSCFLLILAGLSSPIPFLGHSPSSSSSSSSSSGAPGAPCCRGGGRLLQSPPPVAAALCSGVGSDCFPYPLIWVFRDNTNLESSAILPSCCLCSSLLALSSCITSLRT